MLEIYEFGMNETGVFGSSHEATKRSPLGSLNLDDTVLILAG